MGWCASKILQLFYDEKGMAKGNYGNHECR